MSLNCNSSWEYKIQETEYSLQHWLGPTKFIKNFDLENIFMYTSNVRLCKHLFAFVGLLLFCDVLDGFEYYWIYVNICVSKLFTVHSHFISIFKFL